MCRTAMGSGLICVPSGFCRPRNCVSNRLLPIAKRLPTGPKKGQQWRDPMTVTKTQNVQDVFLNNVRKNKTPVTVYLVSGVKLQGIITWFDNFSVLLRRDAHSQLVYKHAISTVMPAAPIQLFEGGKEEEQE